MSENDDLEKVEKEFFDNAVIAVCVVLFIGAILWAWKAWSL